MKRVLTIQDISCVGRCSLSAALPVISACGAECSVLPTAILSAHTAFPDYTFRDMTDEMKCILASWRKQGLRFDAVYSGYLGSAEQLEIVRGILQQQKNAFRLVDPVMGDNGKLYPGFTPDYAAKMLELCRLADWIVPNRTEAAFLLGMQPEEAPEMLLKGLLQAGIRNVALTGIEEEQTVRVLVGCAQGSFSVTRKRYPGIFSGTGDLFASALTGLLVRGQSPREAIGTAVDFLSDAISQTIQDKNSRWYGVNFECSLPLLFRRQPAENK